MDRRVIIPIIVMLVSIILLSGLVNYPAGSAQDSSVQENPVPDEPATVTQTAASTVPTGISSGTTDDVAPDPEPTFTYRRSDGDGKDDDDGDEGSSDDGEGTDDGSDDDADGTDDGSDDDADGTDDGSDDGDGTDDGGEGNDGDSNDDGEGTDDSKESGDEESLYLDTTEQIPEFPTIAIPMLAIIGMAFFFTRRQ